MAYLNLIFIIGLFCSALGSPRENPRGLASSNQKKIVQETLSDEDIKISYATEYDNILNISAITQDNNPDDYLNIYHNIVQEITILDKYTETLELYNQAKADVFDQSEYKKNYNTNKHGISINDGAITADIDLTVSESLQRNVDFTNIDWCSIIKFDAVITGETTLTWATGSINNIKDVNETVAKPNYSSLTDALPLVSANGLDISKCANEECESSTIDKTDMGSYYAFQNVYVMTTKRVYSTVSSTSTASTYSMQSVINISGSVQICSDGTL